MGDELRMPITNEIPNPTMVPYPNAIINRNEILKPAVDRDVFPNPVTDQNPSASLNPLAGENPSAIIDREDITSPVTVQNPAAGANRDDIMGPKTARIQPRASIETISSAQ